MPEDRNDLFDRSETEVLKLENRREEDRKRLTTMQDGGLRRAQTTNIRKLRIVSEFFREESYREREPIGACTYREYVHF